MIGLLKVKRTNVPFMFMKMLIAQWKKPERNIQIWNTQETKTEFPHVDSSDTTADVYTDVNKTHVKWSIKDYSKLKRGSNMHCFALFCGDCNFWRDYGLGRKIVDFVRSPYINRKFINRAKDVRNLLYFFSIQMVSCVEYNWNYTEISIHWKFWPPGVCLVWKNWLIQIQWQCFCTFLIFN